MSIKHQIVVAFDFSPSSEHALASAIDVVARTPGHELHIVSILDRSGGKLIHKHSEISYEHADEVHAAVVERIREAFVDKPTAAEIDVCVHVRIGKPADEILAVARDVGADYIFIGSHGLTGIERVLIGSVSERVVREAKCPVMVVRPRTYPDVERMHVIEYPHERKPFHPPHRYKYTDNRVIKRPDEWPI